MSSYSFRLYVTGETTLSREAEANLRALCKNRLVDDYEIEIVDILERSALAEEEQIIATPTIMRLAPYRVCASSAICPITSERLAPSVFRDRRFAMRGEVE